MKKRILKTTIILGIFSISPFIFFNRMDISLGITVGLCTALTNLSLLIWGAEKTIKLPKKNIQRFSLLMTFLRISILAIIFSGVIINKKINPLSTFISTFINYQIFIFLNYSDSLDKIDQKSPDLSDFSGNYHEKAK